MEYLINKKESDDENHTIWIKSEQVQGTEDSSGDRRQWYVIT